MIRIENVSKTFGSHSVLEGISLEIMQDSHWCLVGRSGSGKSVLMKLLLGLESADTGEIYIDNEPVSQFSRKDWRRTLNRFGVVFQGAALFDSLTILENVGIKLFENREGTPDEIKDRVVHALERVNLSADILDKYPAQLSGGMRKRVGISRAIIHDPTYIIYDEPTTGLDPISSEVIDALIADLASMPGKTSIVITHDMATVRNIATQVAMIHQKKLLFNGTPEGFLKSENPSIQAFLAR